MHEKKYEVWTPDSRLAENMTLETALRLIKMLCMEPADYQIKEMERTCAVCE